MAVRSDVDRRAKKYVAKQCVSDHGMHKDAQKRPKFRSFAPLKTELDALRRKQNGQ